MATIYRAPAPVVSEKERRLFILKCLFPPTLLWMGLKFVCNFFFGRLLGRVIMRPPSVADLEKDNIIIDDISKFNTEDLTCTSEKIITHDGCELDTIEIKHHAQANLPPSEQKYIIYCAGRYGCYEGSMNKIIEMANELKINVKAFNYRGVGKSTGCAYSKRHVYTDVIAQAQCLFYQGIDPEFVTFRGYSFGGAVSTKGTKYFHSQGKMINEFNERSFSNVAHVIAGFLRCIGAPHKSGHTSGKLGVILSYLLYPFVKFALLVCDWEIEAADTFKELDIKHKEYIAVRSPKRELQADENIVDDSGITHYASLHRALKSARREEKKEINDAREHIQRVVTSNPIANSALKKADQCFDEALDYLKSRKMVTKPEQKYKNAHYLDLKDLQCRATGQSGLTFFKNFVMNTQELREKAKREETLDREVVGAAI